jgi:hypothetical protein
VTYYATAACGANCRLENLGPDVFHGHWWPFLDLNQGHH